MNELGLALIWCAARCGLVGLAMIPLVVVLSRRRGPAAGAMAAQAGLNSLLLTAALSFLSLPEGWRIPVGWPASSTFSPATVAPVLALPRPVPAVPPLGPNIEPGAIGSTKRAATYLPYARSLIDVGVVAAGGWHVWVSHRCRLADDHAASVAQSQEHSTSRARPSVDVHQGFYQETTSSVNQVTVSASNAPAWVAVVVSLIWFVGVVRLATALIAVRRQLRRSRPIVEDEVLCLAEEIRVALGCRVPVLIRESDAMALPATVGWFRPCVFMPSCWRDWTTVELRVVLAHELAHVRRGDFLGRLAARLCLIVHFYHPVAHWLAARLRLDQELAADADAIPLSGGRAAYLTTLARMALTLDDRRPDWIGRPQLPFGGSFLRRMDMLCNSNRIGESPVSGTWRTRTLTLGLMFAFAFLAASIRPKNAPADDGDPPIGKAAVEHGPAASAVAPFDLRHVPRDAVGVVAVRPSTILGQEEIRPLMSLAKLGELQKIMAKAADAGIGPEGIDQVIYAQLPVPLESIMKEPESLLKSGVVIIRTVKPLDIPHAAAILDLKLTEASHSGRNYYKARIDSKRELACYQPDERTTIVGPESILLGTMETGTNSEPKRPWAEAWKGVERSHFALAFDAAHVRNLVDPLTLDASTLEASLMLAPVAPVWQGAEQISLGLTIVGDQVEVQTLNTAATSETAEITNQTVQALITLGKNAAGSMKRQLRKIALVSKGGVEGLFIAKMVDLWAGKVLQGMRVERSGNSVRFAARLDLDAFVLLTGAVK
jgi:hypothetical protein